MGAIETTDVLVKHVPLRTLEGLQPYAKLGGQPGEAVSRAGILLYAASELLRRLREDDTATGDPT